MLVDVVCGCLGFVIDVSDSRVACLSGNFCLLVLDWNALVYVDLGCMHCGCFCCQGRCLS